ncbi:MAG TPA: ABC transporter ATP-binding protein [Candidatus Competibacteraceae bacterium]|nr:ABC transporter ATP-binding protein [Candidatus Competibacteraceae bacterium]
MSVVELEQVSKVFERLEALAGLSLRVSEGEVVGLLGHNGAGKSTTMKLILGLIRATGGEVRVFGQPPHGAQAHHLRLRIGYLPENVMFYEQLTGREVLRYFGRLKRVAAGQVDELLERVGLQGAADRRVKTYSKGMRQRLGLAQALLGWPRLLILDEPTVGLDPLAIRDFYTIIDELQAQGVTVILSSHTLSGIERHIDRAVILGGGRLLADGTLEELRARAGLPYRLRAYGRFASDDWPEHLPVPALVTQRAADGCLEFSVAGQDKLAALRGLLDHPAIQDIELEPPSLEALYAYFSAAAESGSLPPCT